MTNREKVEQIRFHTNIALFNLQKLADNDRLGGRLKQDLAKTIQFLKNLHGAADGILKK